MVAATWILLSVSLLVTDSDPAVLVLGGIVAVASAFVFIVIDIGWPADTIDWNDGRRHQAMSVETNRRVAKLKRAARAAVSTNSIVIHATLVDLVDDRLLAGHQIDRSIDSAAADGLLTPTLRKLVADSARHTVSVRELQQILTDIEML